MIIQVQRFSGQEGILPLLFIHLAHLDNASAVPSLCVAASEDGLEVTAGV